MTSMGPPLAPVADLLAQGHLDKLQGSKGLGNSIADCMGLDLDAIEAKLFASILNGLMSIDPGRTT